MAMRKAKKDGKNLGDNMVIRIQSKTLVSDVWYLLFPRQSIFHSIIMVNS